VRDYAAGWLAFRSRRDRRDIVFLVLTLGCALERALEPVTQRAAAARG